jgi:hypothetical protein
MAGDMSDNVKQKILILFLLFYNRSYFSIHSFIVELLHI